MQQRFSYQDLLNIIKHQKNYHITDPFYNSLFFGTKLELQYLAKNSLNLLDDQESLVYMAPGRYHNSNRLVVVTSEKIMFLNKTLWRRGIHEDINLDKINKKSNSGGFFFGKLQIYTGNDEFDQISWLWGQDLDRLLKAITIANNLHQKQQQARQLITTPTTSDNVATKLQSLMQMQQKGALTPEEFQQFKQKLLQHYQT